MADCGLKLELRNLRSGIDSEQSSERFRGNLDSATDANDGHPGHSTFFKHRVIAVRLGYSKQHCYLRDIKRGSGWVKECLGYCFLGRHNFAFLFVLLRPLLFRKSYVYRVDSVVVLTISCGCGRQQGAPKGMEQRSVPDFER
jgi:hypothetical protein